MSTDFDKENIAEGLSARPSFNNAPALSPKKTGKKVRSKSIGPGALGALDAPLKENSGNRRKSAFIPAVKSILATNDEDEKKRREARRKSLARRRVSFAPEATLHTWDVIEYMRDATTSSASSDATRRASSISQASSARSPQSNATSPAPDSDLAEPPSTPPEQTEEPVLGPSPANQCDLRQRKRHRRSSGIPPMNFNNPEDTFSSSPYSGSGSSPTGSDGIEEASDDDGEDTMMSLNAGDAAEPTIDSSSSDSTGMSARLEEALSQAAAQAGTRCIDFDENGDLSMEMEIAEDEITAAFKPWTKKPAATPNPTRNLPSFDDQENIDPFSPAVRAKVISSLSNGLDELEQEDGEDMSMDITRAVGRIIPQQSQSPDAKGAAIDLTMPLGGIQQVAPIDQDSCRRGLKRRRSSMVGASQGSPAKRPVNRRSSIRRRRSSAEDSSLGDETMDLTIAIGGIQGDQSQDNTNRRSSVDPLFGNETMDFTMAVGGIKGITATDETSELEGSEDGNEDLSMEFTALIGGIKGAGPQPSTPVKPTTPKNQTPKARSTSPRKSPGRPGISDTQFSQPSPSPVKPAKATPQKSPRRPARKSLSTPTPEVQSTPQNQTAIEAEPSPFVRKQTRSASKDEPASTPKGAVNFSEQTKAFDNPIILRSISQRLGSPPAVQYSPLPSAREEPVVKSTTALTNSIKLLSTPRKQTLTSPVKRGTTPKKAATPKKPPTPRKTPTPRKSISPKKRVVFGNESPPKEAEEQLTGNEEDEEVEQIPLQDFLDMTNIRFMDLTTTKRRHTAVPPSFHGKGVSGHGGDERDDSLEDFVIAAACIIPEYEMYQHACHELKRYISGGKDVVRQIESDVYEENPALFNEYMSAPPDQRYVMDNHFKNMKTYARLQSKEIWYGWRSTLLRDLKAALIKTGEEFDQDDTILKKQEELLEAVLPVLITQHEELEAECKQLQQRQDELTSCDREELEAAREQLTAADAEIEGKKRLVTSLQEELIQKEASIEAVKERKMECTEEIKAAERVREECRGWSSSEVNAFKDKVTTLELNHGWSIASASSSPSTLTLTHLNDLQLFFYPTSFATNTNTPNAPISLTYIGDSATPHPRPLTTSKRFFLQLLRAHLQCFPQSQTRILDLLNLIRNGWATALAVAEGVRCLSHSYITDEVILSDERIAIRPCMLLPSLQTKVKVSFEVGVGIRTGGIEASVGARAEVVYGEKYKEDKMGEFLGQFVGDNVRGIDEMRCWANAVGDLAGRLKARGRK